MKSSQEILNEIDRIRLKTDNALDDVSYPISALDDLKASIMQLRLSEPEECAHKWHKNPGKPKQKCRKCKQIKDWP